MVLTRLNTTAILCDVTKQISKLTLQDLKLSRANHAYTYSSTQITKAIIKPTLTNTSSRSTTSTESSTQKSIKNFAKLKTVDLVRHE